MKQPVEKPAARNINSFNATHDKATVVVSKIRAAFAKMARVGGKEHYLYEGELVALARISQTEIGKFKGLFKAHIVEVRYADGKYLSSPKNVWFHNASVAARVRKQQQQPAEE